ncbi:MAG: hydrogenase [Proteobacteria bacterium]|nr:hydrogenase [Pseudomonadota bacterium]
MAELFLAALILISCSGLPALACGCSSSLPGPDDTGPSRGSDCRGRWGEMSSLILLLSGVTLALVATLAAVWQSPSPLLVLEWAHPAGQFVLELDGIAVIFLLPALVILGMGGIYGLGYMPQAKAGTKAGRVRFFYGLLGASILLVPVSRNGLLFLMAWEIMALSCFFLILTEQKEESSRRAAYVYLVATHAGTLALFAMFILLADSNGSLDFPRASTLQGATVNAGAVFLLGLFGFGMKAGMMPLHFWLPAAHANAPSHVSAFMSGVMIKMGIYGLVRITSFYLIPPAWWGWLILALGVISAIMGVVFALAQHDIKRLLAYHSVENIGIILIGLGCSLLGRSSHHPALMALGLAGALLHVVNHGLFKSLLFFGAGSVIHATGTRMIDQYGGLLRTMPYTAFFFLGGAMAICGLPPLNGFVSEWLIYLGLLHSQTVGAIFPFSLAVLAVPALAMTGTLALACFVKAFGITFLGTARQDFPIPPQEAPSTMLLPMAVIFLICLAIGLMPWAIVPLLQEGVDSWLGAVSAHASLITTLVPVTWISLGALLLLGTCGAVWYWQRSFREDHYQQRPVTWSCGYIKGTARMQYTAASFAEQLVRLFRWGLWSSVSEGRAIGFFPTLTHFTDHTPDLILDRLIYPTCRTLTRAAFWIRALFHQGRMHVYLLYCALTLCLLLIWLL